MKTRLKKRLSYLLLALLGFSASACKEPVDMYGTPRADTRTQGKVTDKSGNPIPGIRVQSNDDQSNATRTSADGSYDLAGKSTGKTTWLTFTDTDGPENGGQFAEKSLVVEFTEADRTAKSDGWYQGGFARSGVDVELEEKK